jgi:hypothetical protein
MPSEIILKDFVRIFGDGRGGSGVSSKNKDEGNQRQGDDLLEKGSSADKGEESNEQGLTVEILTKLKHGAWLGNYFSKGIRGLCWRVMLGKLSCQGIQSWPNEINAGILKYEHYKQTMLPDLTRIPAEHDPLSGASSNSPEWIQYYKVLPVPSLSSSLI